MDEEKRRIYGRAFIEAIVAVGMVALAVTFGPKVVDILLPFLLAFCLAWMFNPAVQALKNRLGFTRKLYSFIIVLVFYAIVGVALVRFALLLVGQVLDMAGALPSTLAYMQGVYQALLTQIRQLLDKLPAGYEAYETQFLAALDSAWQWIISMLSKALSLAASYTSGFAFALPETVIFLTVLVLASCFITADYPNLRQTIYSKLTPSTRRSVDLLVRSFKAAVMGFFRSQLIFAIIDMGIILTFFFFMKVPYPLPIALVLAFLDFIPFFGAGTIIVPWGIIALVVGYVDMGLQLLLLYAILYVFRRIFEPRILGGQTGFSSLEMLFSMYAGMKLYGVTGLIVAPIVWIAVVNFCRTGIFKGILDDWGVIVGDMRALMARPELEQEMEEKLNERTARKKRAGFFSKRQHRREKEDKTKKP